jgi:hypothetical protein
MLQSNKYAFGLDSASAVMQQASGLVDHLKKTLRLKGDESGEEWTNSNFDALRSFLPKDLQLQDFPSNAMPTSRRERMEFLWDFIAYKQGQGIFLAAESEQETRDRNGKREDLKHDFEKLLYVRAPLKLLICKTETGGTANDLARDLGKFAANACQHFDPGSVLILYCRTSKQGEEDVAFIWRSPGDPNAIFDEPLVFTQMSVA